MFLGFTGLIIVFVILVFVFSQVAVPLSRGTPFFPFFRKSADTVAKEKEIEVQLEQLHLKQRLFSLEKEQEALAKEISDIKTTN